MTYKIKNKTNSKLLAEKAKVADNFFLRLKGLMFDRSLPEVSALIFYRAPSIHTFFMRFAIDLVFLNKSMKVIRIVEALKPWRMILCPGAYVTIELPAHKSSQISLQTGDNLELEAVEKAPRKGVDPFYPKA